MAKTPSELGLIPSTGATAEIAGVKYIASNNQWVLIGSLVPPRENDYGWNNESDPFQAGLQFRVVYTNGNLGGYQSLGNVGEYITLETAKLLGHRYGGLVVQENHDSTGIWILGRDFKPATKYDIYFGIGDPQDFQPIVAKLNRTESDEAVKAGIKAGVFAPLGIGSGPREDVFGASHLTLDGKPLVKGAILPPSWLK